MADLTNQIVSSSYQYLVQTINNKLQDGLGNDLGSLSLSGSFSGSFEGDGSNLTGITNIDYKSGSFATTGSNIFVGNQTINGGLDINQTQYSNAIVIDSDRYIHLNGGSSTGWIFGALSSPSDYIFLEFNKAVSSGTGTFLFHAGTNDKTNVIISTGSLIVNKATIPYTPNHVFEVFGDSFLSGDIRISGNVSASSYYGDGSNLTGITSPWTENGDGSISRNSDVKITGSVNISDEITVDIAQIDTLRVSGYDGQFGGNQLSGRFNLIPPHPQLWFYHDINETIEYGRIRFAGTQEYWHFAFRNDSQPNSIIAFEAEGTSPLRVGMGTTQPSTTLHVAGDVSASSYYGDGSNLTGIFAGYWTGSLDGSISRNSDVKITGKLSLNNANYLSSANLGKFQHSLASRAYVDFQDNPEVLNGYLTHIDSDNQGGFAQKVWGDGNFVYLADVSGLHVYLVDTTGSLNHLDSDSQTGNAYGVWGDGKFIYLANYDGGLHTYSVNSAGILTHIDSDDPGGSAYNVWGDGKFVYIANYNAGLHVYSVNSTGILTHIDSDDQGGTAYDVWGDSNFIYLANYGGGLVVYSVDNTGSLTFVDSDYQGNDHGAVGVWGDGKFVYLASDDGGVYVYLVDNSGHPTFIDSDLQNGYSYRGIWGDGKFVYLTTEGGGVLVYSVSETGKMTLVDSNYQGDNTYGVWGDGKFVYSANSSVGIVVYSINTAYSYDKVLSRHSFSGSIMTDGQQGISGTFEMTGSFQIVNGIIVGVTA